MKLITRLIILVLLVSNLTYGQETGYMFTVKKDIACTPVKNQS